MKERSSRAPSGRKRMGVFPGILPALLLPALVLPLAGCSYFERIPVPAPAEPAPPSAFEVGLARLADGDFSGAELAFRDAASRCESGTQGRRALLLLSFLALDSRNPAAHPDSAALMTERFLNLPDKTLEETLQAEALYVTALDYGADPELQVDPADPGFAVRFGDCDEPLPPKTERPLPTLEDSTSANRLQGLGAERDSLSRQNQQLRSSLRQLRLASDSLRARADTLQTELNRIRQLIQLPDSSFLIRPPDTSLVRLPPDTGSARLLDSSRSRTRLPGLDCLPPDS